MSGLLSGMKTDSGAEFATPRHLQEVSTRIPPEPLAGLKVFLEHGVEPNFVADHAPDALVEGWASRGA
jgi:hypothetical protein